MNQTSDQADADQPPVADAPRRIDRDKVDRLKRAIASGTYSVDEQLLAEKMIKQGFPAH